MANFSEFLQALGLGDDGSPNGYVRNNWPSDGRGAFSVRRPETFYTPGGMKPPPGGREATPGESHQGAPNAGQLMPFLSLLLSQYQRGER